VLQKLLSPRNRRAGAAVLLVLSLVFWPISAVTWAKDEPQFILGLSWLALTLTALDILATTDVRAAGDEEVAHESTVRHVADELDGEQ
jgi:hypothetical protein